MIGREAIFAALDAALSEAKGEAVAVCQGQSSGLTRFAGNRVHQNMHTENTVVSIRARIDQREGIAVTNSLAPSELVATLRRAEAVAAANPPVEDSPPLPGPQEYGEVVTFVDSTAEYSADARARSVKTICEVAKAAGAVASGLLATGAGELAVANTAGLRAYVPLSVAELMAIVGDGPAYGYAAGVSRDMADIDCEAAAKRALAKCRAGRERVEIEPGEYEVILEPAAVAEALEWLNVIGFGARSNEEGTSFLAGREGESITGEAISIYDDGLNAQALGVPFDFEGMPKQRVDFIKRGVCGRGVTDLRSGARSGRVSTGHAVPPGESGWGAMAMNLVMAGGDSDLEEMIASVERGILVTRFHYVNGMIDTRRAVLTGMTRDGTFLIENGKVTSGLRNLRFQQPFMEAFANVRALSRQMRSTPAWWGEYGAYLTPAAQIDRFRFIGVQKEQ
ncbi:MAG: TldD/PmbA family protein [Candidatus Lernaella stagnicola]|nr:TldD/PmbA family protein [Candidatus Lernaella stagnicola]